MGQITHLLAVVGVRAVKELDAGEGAGELAAAGDPRDGGALIEQEGGLEEVDPLLLDEAHTQHLALLLIWYELGWQHLMPTTIHMCCLSPSFSDHSLTHVVNHNAPLQHTSAIDLQRHLARQALCQTFSSTSANAAVKQQKFITSAYLLLPLTFFCPYQSFLTSWNIRKKKT